ncbi:MAG: FAD-binding oxidoreductase [Deltaproteobacteria bacterium]|nr:FAD-binding oxidoreductase [Deltaproteobacteria bacterium]
MEIYGALRDIVGDSFVSNQPEELFLYSRDSGAQPPRKVDYVVMPGSVDDVQKVVLLANKTRTPITPLGGGFTLSALVVPHKGGIVMDMKRMDRIIEVDPINRYVLLEAGVSQAALKSYLDKYHPDLQHSTPEAPPTVTVTGNALIQGHGHISPRYGINSEMINGMEVVLPTGEICRIGSSSLCPAWFTRGPLPDLPGLFIGWYGTTGIVTKLAMKLYPKPRYREVIVFSSDDIDAIPEAIVEITRLDLLEDFFLITQEKPDWMNHVFYVLILSANYEEELELKKRLYRELLTKFKGGNTMTIVEDLHPALEKRFLDVPPLAALSADFRKGGGFEYTGAIFPISSIPQAWRGGMEISHKYSMICSYVHQVLGCHSIMFGFNYSFNRADEEDIEKTRKALDDSNRLTLDLNGMIWKGEVGAQQHTMQKMDPNTAQLIQRVKKLLDPKSIMNPGNWEVAND